MPDTETIFGVGDSKWAAILDEGASLSQEGVGIADPFRVNADLPTNKPLTITATYDLDAIVNPQLSHLIIGINFLDLDSPGENDSFTSGIRGPVNIVIRNDTDVPLGKVNGDTMIVFLADNQSDAVNYLAAPTPANQQTIHALYAHFHGLPNAVGAVDIEGRSLTGGEGTPGAPSTIGIHGVIAPHSSLTIPVGTLHERDQQGIDDSFVMVFYPTTDFITAADFATLKAQYDALHPPPVVTPPTPTASGEVDWDALAGRTNAYFASTGQYGLLEDWLTPPPPDNGPTDYLL